MRSRRTSAYRGPLRAWIAAAIAAVSFAACSTLEVQEDRPPLHGMVYDEENRPVADAEIFVDGKIRARSDVSGRFVLADLVPGSYEVMLRKELHEEIRVPLEYSSPTQVIYAKMISADQLLAEAERELERRNWTGTSRALDRSLALRPDFPPALYLKASLLSRRGDAEGARDILTRLLALGVDDPFVRLFLADLYQYRFGDDAAAAAYLRGFLELRYDPEVEKRLKEVTNSTKK